MHSTLYYSIQYATEKSKKFHSLIIGKDKKWYNTWDDWCLIPSSRPLINPPAPKTKFVDIPGRDGVLDLSEIVNPYTVYGNRTGSIEFIVVNRNMDAYYNELTDNQRENFTATWYSVYSNILSFLQGKSGLQCMLVDDLNFYYEGRISVNSWKSSESWSTITLDYNVKPYKMRMNTSLEPWLWNPFSFVDGVIRYANSEPVAKNGTKVVTIVGDAIRETPWIIATEDMTVTFKGRQYPIKKNTSYKAIPHPLGNPSEQGYYDRVVAQDGTVSYVKSVDTKVQTDETTGRPSKTYYQGVGMQVPDIVIVEGENKLTFTGGSKAGEVSVEYRGGSL